MKSILIPFFVLLAFAANAQYAATVSIKDQATGEPMNGVTVVVKSNQKNAAASQADGSVTIRNLPKGLSTLIFSYVGYEAAELTVHLPDTSSYVVLMQKDTQSLEGVIVVSSTRSNDRIENATTKVEVLGLEDMNEESTLKPGNIASILGDLSGVQIQQSSLTSGNSNVRIQGLDGKYTQVLRDGMPLYGGYAGGFGILSIPPLDLKQVELIKGSSSTLYGGGAIAGLVNLISKKPGYKPDALFLINQTTLKETNVNAYYAQRWKHSGFTFFAGHTFQKAVDVNNDGFSDVPFTKATVIHPSVFIYPSATSYLMLSWSGAFDTRNGGDMIALQDKASPDHPYFENNKLRRNLFTLLAENKFPNNFTLNIKASASLFHRSETSNTNSFKGRQVNYYSEISFLKIAGLHNIVGGVNVTGDKFTPSAATPVALGSLHNNTAGIFAQDTWKFLPSTKLEAGLRLDKHQQYGTFVLPRLALFHHLSKAWGTRLGFGMGYTTPNPLTPQVTDYFIYQLQPLASNVTAEKSYAGNFEINYKKEWSAESSFFINHAFFITQINTPLVATEDGFGNVHFANQPKPLLTKGFDTYVQIKADHWEVYVGYTYTDATRKYLQQNQFVLYTPKHRAATTILYEAEGNFRIGLEASYTGYQYRDDYTKTPGYLFMAAMAEKKFGPRWSLVLNCENLLDERQSKYESLYIGTVTNPAFKTLWAPADGRVLNLCLRFQPFSSKQ